MIFKGIIIGEGEIYTIPKYFEDTYMYVTFSIGNLVL